MTNQGLPSSFNSTNYARIGHAAQQLLPNILQELLLIKEPPSLLQGRVINNTFLNTTLRPEEWLLINNVTTKGYADFDIPLSYKIIRNLNIVQSPTSGWNNQSGPSSTEITVGDDIERIRRIRNEIIHRGNANVTDGELNDYFYKLREIAARLEMYLGKQNGEFVSKLDHLKFCCMDSEIENIYIRKLEELKDRERALEDILAGNISRFDNEFNVVHGELSDVDEHISRVDDRLSGVDEQVLRIEQQVSRVDDEIIDVHGDLSRVEQQVSRVDEQVLLVDRQVSRMNEQIGRLLSTEAETDAYQLEIDEWESEDKKFFVETSAFTKILNFLKENNSITITGISGVGKSMMIRHVALHLRNQDNHTILPCCSPYEIEAYYRKDKDQIFVFDDVCGRYTAIQNEIEEWVRYEQKIKRILKTGKIKLLASCRSQVFKEFQVQRLQLLTQNVLCFPSEKCSLTQEEKVSIAQKYLSNAYVEKVKHKLNEYDFFPLICSLCRTNQTVDVVKFFMDPYIIYNSELKFLSEQKDKLKICTLFLCTVVNNGLINESDLLNDHNDEENKKRKQIFKAFGVDPHTSLQSILDQLYALTHTYLKKSDVWFLPIHDKLFDIICNFFGQNYQIMFIKFGNSNVISERTKLKSLKTDHCDFTILIDENNENNYFNRITDDLSKGRFDQVLNNTQFKFPEYLSKLMSFMITNDQTHLIRLINAKDENGSTPLIWACLNRRKDVVEMLMTTGADINLVDFTGNTPLQNALDSGNVEIAEILISKGANVQLGSSVHSACRIGYRHIVELIIHNGVDINKRDNRGRTPLLIACSHVQEDIVNFLLDNSCDIHHSDKMGDTPLSAACRSGSKGIAQKLLSKGAKVNKATANGWTALMSACNLGYKTITDLLIQHGAKLNCTTNNGWTPLMFACGSGSASLVLSLINKGADLFKVTTHGWSALFMACEKGHYDIVTLLLRKNSNANLSDRKGLTPLILACRTGNLRLCYRLIDNQANVNLSTKDAFYPIMAACEYGYISIMNALIDQGANIEVTNNEGWTPLMFGCQYGHIHIARTLISESVKINTANNRGQTALMIACKYLQKDIVNFLVCNGADINKVDAEGSTPFSIARETSYKSIIDILVGHGANE